MTVSKEGATVGDYKTAIKAGDADRAEQIMRSHVQDFYDKVREVLAEPR